jgi:hypothetical protein
MSAATIGGTFDGHKSESPRKAETIIMPIDAYGREGGEEVIILLFENLSDSEGFLQEHTYELKLKLSPNVLSPNVA